MKRLVSAILFSLFMLLPISRGAFAEDYFKNALVPEGADDRSCQVYPAYDFEDVIFTREYFYSLEEGMAQYDRTYGGTWNALDFGREIFGIGVNKGNTE